jgi:hypothetical protein
VTDDESAVGSRASRFDPGAIWAIGSLVGVAAGTAFSVRLGSAFGMLATVLVTPAVVVLVNAVRYARHRDRTRLIPDLCAPGGVLLILLGAREGLFGDALHYDLNCYQSHATSNWNVTSNASRHSPADRAVPGTRVKVRSGDGEGGQVVDGLRERIGQSDWRSCDLTLDVDANVDDSYDFLPLWKSGEFSVRVRVKARWNGPRSSGDLTLDVTGTIALTMEGVASRRQFNWKVGETIADKAVDAVNEEIGKD